MGISTRKLKFLNLLGSVEVCDLYTAVGDVGLNPVYVYDPVIGSQYYSKLVDINDAYGRASTLRMPDINGITKAVAATIEFLFPVTNILTCDVHSHLQSQTDYGYFYGVSDAYVTSSIWTNMGSIGTWIGRTSGFMYQERTDSAYSTTDFPYTGYYLTGNGCDKVYVSSVTTASRSVTDGTTTTTYYQIRLNVSGQTPTATTGTVVRWRYDGVSYTYHNYFRYTSLSGAGAVVGATFPAEAALPAGTTITSIDTNNKIVYLSAYFTAPPGGTQYPQRTYNITVIDNYLDYTTLGTVQVGDSITTTAGTSPPPGFSQAVTVQSIDTGNKRIYPSVAPTSDPGSQSYRFYRVEVRVD